MKNVLIRARNERRTLGYISDATRAEMAKLGLNVSDVEWFLNTVGE